MDTLTLEQLIRMWQSAHPDEHSYLLDALAEAARLIANLQQRVAELEEAQPGYDASDPKQNPWIISADEAERMSRRGAF